MKRHPFVAPRTALSWLAALLLSAVPGAAALADDGEQQLRSMSDPGPTRENPVPEAEHAFIDMMKFYVLAQKASGLIEPIEYYDLDGALVDTRSYAKPLIGVFIYGPVIGIEGTGFVGHGARDAFAAVSLDDGDTWKRTNLSESADLSSFEVSVPFPNPTAPSDGTDGEIVVDAETPTISSATWQATGEAGGILEVIGADAPAKARVEVRNAVTREVLLSKKAKQDGTFKIKEVVDAPPPCYVQAGVDDEFGPAEEVEGAEDCEGVPSTLTEYPGDVINVFQATAGNFALVAWPSRYCSSGQPNYSLETSNPERRAAIADYLGINLDDPSADDLYLVDMYGVAGQQGSVDYTEDRFEQNRPVGEVPYACLWTARGVMVNGDDPRTTAAEASYMRWFKAERITSGRRDVNRIETKCVAGAGCAITWQEDPEGLRPGQGEGPGEGWSGAIANRQTDVWYTYIGWDHFDLVQDAADDTGILTFQEYLDSGVTAKPQVAIPLAMPMRVTDNARCNVTNPQPYCNGAAVGNTEVLNPLDYDLKDVCADTVQIPTGRHGTLADICVTEDGLPLVGNIAATRPRLGLYGYDSDGDGVTENAWVIFEAEESKGLGAFGFDDGGAPCEPEVDEGCIGFDEGKNLWYYSFNMKLPTEAEAATARDDPDSLVANLAGHGNMLNQPEVNWETGEFYPAANTVDLWDFGVYNYDIYPTEIARRGSLLAQPIGKFGPSGLAALPAWKQGIMRQGGPADVMVRRIVAPAGFNPAADNPYAFRNMDCDAWLVEAGTNPFYPDGLCRDSAINLSGYIPDTCIDSQTGGEVTCPQVELGLGTEFGVGDTNPILQGLVPGEGDTTKVLTWHQCPAEFTTVGGTTLDCSNDARSDESTLADQSWYNPLDVSKGHRGYLDGDFVMMLYAWSPNWRLNAVGNDRYELYIRRSFDGGETWTTLPGSFAASDGLTYSGAGTVTCETFRSDQTQAGGDLIEPRVCNSYAAGAAEQSRNVTQHRSMRITTLDPRYAPAPASIDADPFLTGYVFTDEDVRNPSRYFIVYETGDNTTTAEGEPEPEDLFYSRAVAFGDHYQVWAEETDLSVCYPSDPHDTEVPVELIGSGFCNEFDQMDQGTPGLSASEASLEANPGGEFMYGVWAQWLHDDLSDALVDSDAMARRLWWIDDYIPTQAWTLPGSGQGSSLP